MTRQIYQLALLAIVITLLSISALANEKLNSAFGTNRNSAFDLYEFSLAVNKEKFQVGEDIEITLTLKNNDWQTVYYVIDRIHEFEYYKIDLKSEDGKDVAPINDGKK